jgi:hypothetical protein
VSPFHSPELVVSVSLLTGDPVMDGAVEEDGGEPGGSATGEVAGEKAVADPAEFVAVTLTRAVDPAADGGGKKLDAVAPPTGEQESPPASQMLH